MFIAARNLFPIVMTISTGIPVFPGHRFSEFHSAMSAKRGVEFLRQYFGSTSKAETFRRVLGSKVKIVSGGDGRCIGELTVEKEFENENGTLHGGMTATLVDVMTTAALMTTEGGQPGASIDMNVTYLGAAKSGETVVITATVLRQGKTLAFTAADFRKKDGTIVALARHTKAFPPVAKAPK